MEIYFQGKSLLQAFQPKRINVSALECNFFTGNCTRVQKSKSFDRIAMRQRINTRQDQAAGGRELQAISVEPNGLNPFVFHSLQAYSP
jgi:hypothetical protein